MSALLCRSALPVARRGLSPPHAVAVRRMSGEPPPRHGVIIVNPDMIPSEFPNLQAKFTPVLRTLGMAAVGLSVVSYFVVWARAQDWAGNLGERPSEKARKAKEAKDKEH